MGDETRTRTITWDDPAAHAWRADSGQGLEVLRRVIAGELPQSPMARLMGFALVEVSDGQAVFASTPAEYHYNPAGVVHGGYAATLLDSAMGCAVYTTVPAGLLYTTAELKVNLLRPITLQTGPVRATATVLHRGRRTAMAEGRLVDAHGRLLAHATTTCLIYSP